MRRKTLSVNVIGILCAAAALFAGVARAADVAANAEERRQRETRLIETLKSNASVAEKDEACRELQVIGTPACIPALAALLPDQELSHMARYVLEPMSYPEAGQALREALRKTTGAAKVGVINSLGFREDNKAVPELIPLFKDPDADVAVAAVAALGRIGTPKAIRALAKLRREAPEGLRAVVAEASLTAAERLLRQGKQKDAAKIYESLVGPGGARHVRQGAFAGLLTAKPDEAVGRVVRAIMGNDPVLMSVAIGSVAALKDQGIAKRLASELPKASPDLQVLLLGALAQCGDAAARSAIANATSSPSSEVRVVAIEALGKTGDAACVEVLSKIVAEGKSDAEKQGAVKSLERLAGEGINAAVLASLKSAPAGARAQLIGVLVARNATDAVNGLLDEARASDAGVRAAAFKALGRLAGPKALPALLDLLVKMEGEEARGEAERAVAQVSRKIAEEETRADAILSALKQAQATPAKCSLLRALGGIADAKALDAVRRALEEKPPEVRDAAIRVLADWPDAGGMDALLAELPKTDNPTHRVLILRGCVRILGQSDRPASQTLETYKELMKAAQGPEDRKLLLAGLAGVADPEGLKLVEPCLKDPEVRAEAELAAAGIASRIAGSAPEEAKKWAGKLQAESKSDEVRKQAAEILRQIEELGDYLAAWQVSGPYAQGNRKASQLLDFAFPPEKSPPGGKWQIFSAGGRPGKPWMVDLAAALGGEQCAAYARSRILSDRAQAARLEMGVDDGVKAWLNGEVIHTNNSTGPAVPGEEKVDVSLKEGENLLMLKIVQHTGPWEFCASLRAPDGGKIAGVRAAAAPGKSPEAARPGGASKAKPKKGTEASKKASKAAKKTSEAAGKQEADWTQLFNGKDLAGWSRTGEAVFTVEDGCLVGTQTTGKGGDLWSNGEWADFEMRVTYRVVWPANTGFWFRHDGKAGYQFDVLKYPKPVAFSGTLYCPGKMFLTVNLNESLENRDDWNEARVRAKGDEITLWLNGTQVGQCRDATHQKGKIGIQVHPGDNFKGMKVLVKKMEIRPL